MRFHPHRSTIGPRGCAQLTAMPDQPDASAPASDPVSLMKQAAVGMHEMFLTFIEGGFTEAQALSIISGVIAAGMYQGGGQ